MAMICPDCGNMIAYNSYFSAFYCPRCGGIFKKVKPMTNADRFRAMSDKEQQSFVRGFWEIEDFADWLQQPAKGE